MIKFSFGDMIYFNVLIFLQKSGSIDQLLKIFFLGVQEDHFMYRHALTIKLI